MYEYKDEKVCFITGYRGMYGFDIHHVLNGPLRDWSDEQGLWVYLRSDVHKWLHSTGLGRKTMNELKKNAQLKWEELNRDKYDDVHAEWMKVVRKNYV